MSFASSTTWGRAASAPSDRATAQCSRPATCPFDGYRAGSSLNELTDHAYTSQRENMDIGLYDYNARYYAPTLARFLSPDTLIPDPANPQALNRYTYVFNSPLIYNDPGGHCPWCIVIGGGIVVGGAVAVAIDAHQYWYPLSYPKITEVNGHRIDPPTSSDMTGWLVTQMVTTANSQVVAEMASYWQGDPLDQMGVLAAWASLVRTDALWDFKPDIINAGVKGGDDLITLGTHNFNYQAVANIFYGFIGRQVGMSEGLLQLGAGLAQIENGVGHWLNNLKDYPQGFGDQEFDAWAIGFGYYLHDLYGDDLSQLTEETFTKTLDNYIANNPIPSGP